MNIHLTTTIYILLLLTEIFKRNFFLHYYYFFNFQKFYYFLISHISIPIFLSSPLIFLFSPHTVLIQLFVTPLVFIA